MTAPWNTFIVFSYGHLLCLYDFVARQNNKWTFKVFHEDSIPVNNSRTYLLYNILKHISCVKEGNYKLNSVFFFISHYRLKVTIIYFVLLLEKFFLKIIDNIFFIILKALWLFIEFIF